MGRWEAVEPSVDDQLPRLVELGGPVEYLRICREWLEDGWERDLVFRSPADATD
ncbi:hypothetical protein KEF29_34820 [Streptomyces tuirus]|uniref:Uncharacterized protein n=1 Tax=Streptomyces tuirus TaxID=68278 RepID=A0A941FM98_9ACTN|nr:hypothetical protein [Streptomyces tuirus]